MLAPHCTFKGGAVRRLPTRAALCPPPPLHLIAADALGDSPAAPPHLAALRVPPQVRPEFFGVVATHLEGRSGIDCYYRWCQLVRIKADAAPAAGAAAAAGAVVAGGATAPPAGGGRLRRRRQTSSLRRWPRPSRQASAALSPPRPRMARQVGHRTARRVRAASTSPRFCRSLALVFAALDATFRRPALISTGSGSIAMHAGVRCTATAPGATPVRR